MKQLCSSYGTRVSLVRAGQQMNLRDSLAGLRGADLSGIMSLVFF